jgi:hypothetical protein
MKEGWLKKGLKNASREYEVYIKLKKKDFKASPELYHQFHMLWGKAVDNRNNYDKKEWQELRNLLEEHGVII